MNLFHRAPDHYMRQQNDFSHSLFSQPVNWNVSSAENPSLRLETLELGPPIPASPMFPNIPNLYTTQIGAAAMLPNPMKTTTNSLQATAPITFQLHDLIQNQTDKRDQKNKRKKRLKRKADLARVARHKKKQRTEELVTQVTDLQSQLLLLKAENVRLLAARSRLPPPPVDMQDLFHAQAVDTRKSLAALLEGQKQPTIVRVLQWMLAERPAFHKDQDGLFQSLFNKHLKATPEQIKTILSWRQESKEDVSDASLKAAFDKLSKLTEDRACSPAPEKFSEFCSVLTPEQVASYLKWVGAFGHICVKINT